jgi:hypothetical protein
MREGLDWIQRSITDRRARPFQENTFAIRHQKSGQAPIAVDICKDGIAAANPGSQYRTTYFMPRSP